MLIFIKGVSTLFENSFTLRVENMLCWNYEEIRSHIEQLIKQKLLSKVPCGTGAKAGAQGWLGAFAAEPFLLLTDYFELF